MDDNTVKELLNLIAGLNINKCAYTTFDLGIQECARQEIIKGLAQHYGITYHMPQQNVKLFPVKKAGRA